MEKFKETSEPTTSSPKNSTTAAKENTTSTEITIKHLKKELFSNIKENDVELNTILKRQ